jgi:hypothetical protein
MDLINGKWRRSAIRARIVQVDEFLLEQEELLKKCLKKFNLTIEDLDLIIDQKNKGGLN